MLINLGDFWFLIVQNGDDWVLLFVSGICSVQFIQVIIIGMFVEFCVILVILLNVVVMIVCLLLVGQLNNSGCVVLDDLLFDMGLLFLEDCLFESLNDFVDFLRDNLDLIIVLVGYMDSFGLFEVNIVLFKCCVMVVLECLISDYGVNFDQLEVEGMGYLLLIVLNFMELGWEINWWVEVIIILIE